MAARSVRVSPAAVTSFRDPAPPRERSCNRDLVSKIGQKLTTCEIVCNYEAWEDECSVRPDHNLKFRHFGVL